MAHYIIVGASAGIGKELSLMLLSEGHTVTGISRRNADFLTAQYNLDVLTDALPVIEGPIDGIAYCIGSINLKPFRSLKVEDFKNDIEVNVMGAIKVLQQYAPQLQQSSTASVVLFSTVAVQTGMAFHASVAAAKGAVEGLTRSLAAEWAPKVRVNCIAPSLTDTPLAAKLLDNDTKRQAAADRHPLKKVGNAKHIAAMAKFLLSEEAEFMTGQTVKMDGGMSSVRV